MTTVLTRLLRVVTVLLLIWAALLNARFVASAGPLWRDEANSVALASLPSWNDLWVSLQYDSFPLLYPALLRLWISFAPAASDSGLRVLGLCSGMAVLFSIYIIAGRLGSPSAAIALILLAVDPVLISEACSLRPYGLGLVLVLWAYYSQWTCLSRTSASRLTGSAFLSVLAVQVSYNNAIFIAVFGLSAAAIAFARGEKKTALLVLAPGACAAMSLVPYLPPLQRAQGWVTLLHYRVDWLEFFKTYTKAHTAIFPLIWVSVVALAAFCVLRRLRRPAAEHVYPEAVSYALAVAAAVLVCQVVFIHWVRVPPFPRYMLPVLLFSALALQLVIGVSARAGQIVVVIVMTFAAGLHAWPSLGMRRSNMDTVARVLSQQARRGDQIVLSPWFLHPGFQRYYHGTTRWVTVPEMPQSPITRYDAFKSAMLAGAPSALITEPVAMTLREGGRVWLIHQAIGWVPVENVAPEVPAVPAVPDGTEYVRFRSYWEREIWYRLRSCCTAREIELPMSGPVWDEERLQLTLFAGHQNK